MADPRRATAAGPFSDTASKVTQPITLSSLPPAQLADEVSTLCGYAPGTFNGTPAVLAYNEKQTISADVYVTRIFSTCGNATNFNHAMWLLSCPQQLATGDGSDAQAAGCTCATADEWQKNLKAAMGPFSGCYGGSQGWNAQLQTLPGYWWAVGELLPAWSDMGLRPSHSRENS